MKKVLIIEDEAETSDVIESWLHIANYKSFVVTNYEEAIKHIQNNHRDYSLIVMDLKLPFNNSSEETKFLGQEIAKKLHEQGILIWIKFMSNWPDIDISNVKRLSTYSSFYNKPVAKRRFMKNVQYCLSEPIDY